MSRQTLIDQLENYGTLYPDELDTVRQFSDFVQCYANCFERTLLAGHVTGSAWLVNRAGTHVLLTHHRKLNKWLQLGGHADGNTDALTVALREAREESGIDTITPLATTLFDIDIHEIPARGSEPSHYHYDARFALTATDTDDFIVSEESHALEWIAIDNLSGKTRECSMLRMADKWIGRARRASDRGA